MKVSSHGPKFVHARAKPLVVCGILACLLGSAQVTAALVYVPANQRALQKALAKDTGAGTQQIVFGGSTGAAVIDTGSATFSTNGSNALQVSRALGVRNPSGNSLPVVVEAAAAAASFVPIIRGGLAVASILGTGVALYDFANELGYQLVAVPGAEPIVQKADPVICGVAPCYSWGQPGSTSIRHPTSTAAVDAFLSVNACTATHYISNQYGSGLSAWAFHTFSTACKGSTGTYVYQNQTRSPDVPTYTPVTMAELENAIASKSGWPSNSKLADAVAQSLDLTGNTLETGTPTVSGPASSTGTTSTTTNPDGSTSTKTITYNHTYEGATVNTTTVTVTNNYNPTTNTTEITTITEEPVAKEETPTDCEKNPNMVGCQELGDVLTDEVPKKTETLTFSEESTGLGSGSCPAPVSASTTLGTFSVSFSPYCDFLGTYVKPVVILMAMLAALFIVAPVRTDA